MQTIVSDEERNAWPYCLQEQARGMLAMASTFDDDDGPAHG